MRPAQSLPEALGRGVFSMPDAHALGVTASRLRGMEFTTLTPGVRAFAAYPRDPIALARGVQRLVPDAVISHLTAALIWELPLPRGCDTSVANLTRATGESRRAPVRRRGVVGYCRDLPRDDVTRRRDGTLVTSPTRTFCDLAPLLGLDELVAIGDAIVCHHPQRSSLRPLATLSRLRDAVANASRRRGVRRARAALDLIRVGSDSAPETQLRLDLVRAGLPEPKLNVAIRNSARAVWPDLAYVVRRISIQYDGGHHADAQQYRSDIRRGDATAAAGWTEVRISADDMRRQVEHPQLGRCSYAVYKVWEALTAAGDLH